MCGKKTASHFSAAHFSASNAVPSKKACRRCRKCGFVSLALQRAVEKNWGMTVGESFYRKIFLPTNPGTSISPATEAFLETQPESVIDSNRTIAGSPDSLSIRMVRFFKESIRSRAWLTRIRQHRPLVATSRKSVPQNRGR